MATYTIFINERTREGKSLLEYLKNLGLIKTTENKMNAVQKSLKEAAEGQVFKAKNVDDFFKQLEK